MSLPRHGELTRTRSGQQGSALPASFSAKGGSRDLKRQGCCCFFSNAGRGALLFVRGGARAKFEGCGGARRRCQCPWRCTCQRRRSLARRWRRTPPQPPRSPSPRADRAAEHGEQPSRSRGSRVRPTSRGRPHRQPQRWPSSGAWWPLRRVCSTDHPAAHRGSLPTRAPWGPPMPVCAPDTKRRREARSRARCGRGSGGDHGASPGGGPPAPQKEQRRRR